MKILKTVCALALALLLALSLAACGNVTSSSSPLMADQLEPIQATVVKCSKTPDGQWQLMVAGERGLSFLTCSEADETAGSLLPGAVIDIAGVVVVQTSYPSTLCGESICVTVVEPGQNFIGLYLDVLNSLYDEETSLNPQGSSDFSITYAFDLTEVHNLSEAEKHALVYLFTCSHDTDWETGAQPAGGRLATYQELVKQGEIDEKALRFEHGILFTVQDEPAQNGSFPFSVKKWRSASETVCHENCTAQKIGDGWTFDGFA